MSEWMGYALLFESMLDSVLNARDKYLRPGGAVLPDRASIHVAGVNQKALGLGFWKVGRGFRVWGSSVGRWGEGSGMGHVDGSLIFGWIPHIVI